MSSMLDLAAALGGGPGGPPPGPPPDGGAPPDDTAQGGGGGGGDFASSLDALDAAEEALHAFIQLDPDQVDRAQATKALQIVVGLKADNQKSQQAGDLKSLSRALQNTPGPVGG